MSYEPIEHHIADGKGEPEARYNWFSIVLNWLMVFGLVAMVATYEISSFRFHLEMAIAIVIVMLILIPYRMARGFPRSHDQHPGLSFLERVVTILASLALLFAAGTVALTPLFQDETYRLFGAVEWRAPYRGDRTIAEWLQQAQEPARLALIPLIGIMALTSAKHAFLDKPSSAWRLVLPKRGGK